ncbi:MAG: hypothetical protein N3D84_04170, partial [Candidatus Woesearchaeota archaeon]|nr:hypothetical protein [Candidatus Woesearchaeota archaeon]
VEVPQEADISLIKINKNNNRQQKKPLALRLPPKKQEVEVGISDDNYYEIISGLKEGDYIITEVISPQKKTPVTTRQNSLFNTRFRMPAGGMPIR